MRLETLVCREIAYNVFCKSFNKLGHTEKSIKELIKEEVNKKKNDYFLSEKELNSLYQGYLFFQSLQIEKPTDEIKDLALKVLNNSEDIYNHFEIVRPFQLEQFLGIKLNDNEIQNNIKLLLTNEKIISTSPNYLKDKREQTKNWINESINNYSIIDSLGLEIFLTATNKALYDEIIKSYGNKKYKERLKTKLSRLNEEEKTLYKEEIEDIKRCILKKDFKAELFILFDSILNKLSIKNIRVSRNKKRQDIPIFNTLNKSIITKIEK